MASESTLKNFLTDYTDKIKKGNDFLGYFVALCTFIFTLYTTKFEDKYGIDAEYWHLFVCTAIVVLLIKVVKAAFYAIRSWNTNPDKLIQQMRRAGMIEYTQAENKTQSMPD